MEDSESPRKKRRRERLELLLREFGGAAQVSRETGTPKSHFSALASGTRGIGDALAAKLEQIYSKPSGWFDMPIPEGSYIDSGDTKPGPDIRGQVPLISWVRAGELCESHDNYHPGDAEHWMDCPVPHGPRTYCLEISGDSMDDGGADAYRDGEIIFVDPDASADPGRDVVVRTPDNKTTFKRLKKDTEGRYLLGLNGKKIVRVPEGTEFCGVVIFSGRRR